MELRARCVAQALGAWFQSASRWLFSKIQIDHVASALHATNCDENFRISTTSIDTYFLNARTFQQPGSAEPFNIVPMDWGGQINRGFLSILFLLHVHMNVLSTKQGAEPLSLNQLLDGSSITTAPGAFVVFSRQALVLRALAATTPCAKFSAVLPSAPARTAT